MRRYQKETDEIAKLVNDMAKAEEVYELYLAVEQIRDKAGMLHSQINYDCTRYGHKTACEFTDKL